MVTSIKTSIDDETLMELAKKGISADTPVEKERPAEKKKKLIESEGRICKASKDVTTFRLTTPAETPDSNNLKLHSTLQLSEKSASCRMNLKN